MTGNPLVVDAWWTPNCGAIHITDRPAFSWHCPDGLDGWGGK